MLDWIPNTYAKLRGRHRCRLKKRDLPSHTGRAKALPGWQPVCSCGWEGAIYDRESRADRSRKLHEEQ